MDNFGSIPTRNQLRGFKGVGANVGSMLLVCCEWVWCLGLIVISGKTLDAYGAEGYRASDLGPPLQGEQVDMRGLSMYYPTPTQGLKPKGTEFVAYLKFIEHVPRRQGRFPKRSTLSLSNHRQLSRKTLHHKIVISSTKTVNPKLWIPEPRTLDAKTPGHVLMHLVNWKGHHQSSWKQFQTSVAVDGDSSQPFAAL